MVEITKNKPNKIKTGINKIWNEVSDLDFKIKKIKEILKEDCIEVLILSEKGKLTLKKISVIKDTDEIFENDDGSCFDCGGVSPYQKEYEEILKSKPNYRG